MTTEKQRESFKKELAQTEDWLYEDGEAETDAVFKCVSTIPLPTLLCMYSYAVKKGVH